MTITRSRATLPMPCLVSRSICQHPTTLVCSTIKIDATLEETVESKPQFDGLTLTNQLCFDLYAASRAVIKAYRPLLDPLGLTYPQYLVLLVLWEHDGQTVKALGQALQLDSGTLSPLLKRLESAGLIRRQRRADDEREVAVELSEAGVALKERAASVPTAIACKVGLRGAERRALQTELRRLMVALAADQPGD